MTGRVFAAPVVTPTERIFNGDFALGDTGWTVGTGWVILVNNATNLLTAQSLTTTLISPTANGQTADVSFTVTDDPNGSQLLLRLRASVGGATQALYFNFPDAGANGPFPISINGAYDLLDIRTSSANGIVIDDISVVC